MLKSLFDLLVVMSAAPFWLPVLLVGYFRSSRIEHGLLINFGAPRLEVRKYVLSEL